MLGSQLAETARDEPLNTKGKHASYPRNQFYHRIPKHNMYRVSKDTLYVEIKTEFGGFQIYT